MDDFKVLLYIIFGIIWIISRVMKGKKKQQSSEAESRPQYEAPKKEVSFEDLLKEFTEGGSTTQQEEYREEYIEPEQEVISKSWEGSDEEASSVYEQSIKDAAKVDLVDQGHDHHLERFGVFEEEEEDTYLQELREDLQNDDGLKRAVIYKEILDRKHF